MNDTSTLKFLETIRDMISKDEYFIPYIWAERQYRDDNYQMGSQSLLEDLFFDTLGDFIAKNQVNSSWHRRSGKEPWDYRFNSLEVSHKEAITPLFTESWRPGLGPKHTIPQKPTVTFSHPITLVYTPKRTNMIAVYSPSQQQRVEVNLTSVSYTSIKLDLFRSLPIVACIREKHGFKVTKVWKRKEWDQLSFRQLRSEFGGRELSKLEIFHLKPHKSMSEHESLNLDYLQIAKEDLQSGIYFLDKSTLVDVPLIANNKAHFPDKDTVRNLMKIALESDRFISLPVWPTVFAKTATPDLYKIQKEQYDQLFSARGN